MKKLPLQTTRGFTLIELLVVIAIIGILASTVLMALNDSRGAARDSRRLAEMKQFQTALELFRNNNSNVYPCSTANWVWGGNRVQRMDGTAEPGSVVANNRPAGCSDIRSYIDLPLDPFYTDQSSQLLYRSVPNVGGTNYVLRARMGGDRYYAADNTGRYCIVIHGTVSLPVGWDVYPACF